MGGHKWWLVKHQKEVVVAYLKVLPQYLTVGTKISKILKKKKK
jgi:hypothetical protein